MEKQFRVRKATYYDEYGNVKHETHYVQKRKSILGIKYWSSVHTYFDSFFEAYEFANKLKTGLLVNKHKEEVITYV